MAMVVVVCVSFVCFLLLRNNSFDIKKRVVFKLCELLL